MIFSFLFFLFVLSPGLRGLPFVYYPILCFSAIGSIYFLFHNNSRFYFNTIRSLPILFLFLIFLFVLLSLFNLSSLVPFSELVVSLLRFSLAFVFLFLIVFNRSNDVASYLFLAFVFAASISSLFLFLQPLLNFPFPFLSAASHERATLVRYASSLGSLTAASIGHPFICFCFSTFRYLFLSKPHIISNKLVKYIVSLPSGLFYFLWLSPLIFTLSRTALFTSIIFLFSEFILPRLTPLFLLRPTLNFRFRLSKSLLFYVLLLFSGLVILFSKFSRFILILPQFLNPAAGSALSDDGVNSVVDDFLQRVFYFDLDTPNQLRFLYGDGYHHVSGSLGITSAGHFSHNTFLDLYHIFGFSGPLLLLLILIIHIFLAYAGYLNSGTNLSSSDKLFIFTSNIGFILIYLPTLLTYSGVVYVPLFMLPLVCVYIFNILIFPPRPRRLSR